MIEKLRVSSVELSVVFNVVLTLNSTISNEKNQIGLKDINLSKAHPKE